VTTIPFVEYDIRADLGSPEWYEAPTEPTYLQCLGLINHVQAWQYLFYIQRLNRNWREFHDRTL
jgi:hypothetical protein